MTNMFAGIGWEVCHSLTNVQNFIHMVSARKKYFLFFREIEAEIHRQTDKTDSEETALPCSPTGIPQKKYQGIPAGTTGYSGEDIGLFPAKIPTGGGTGTDDRLFLAKNGKSVSWWRILSAG